MKKPKKKIKGKCKENAGKKRKNNDKLDFGYNIF